MQRIDFIMMAMALLFISGCGESGPEMFEVTGMATVNGEPIPLGTITFVSSDGKRSDGAEITDGEFTFTSNAGKKRVEITGSKEKAGAKPVKNLDDDQFVPRESIVPDRYNKRSELTAEVIAGENEPFLFDLKVD